MTLPSFKYHPDPLRSGSVVPSETRCVCCRQVRGHVYTGPVYTEAGLPDDSLCPWCIAEGKAFETFDVTFVDIEAFGDGISDATMTEISERTPGYVSWQGEAWPACCGDATAFITPAGIAELRAIDYRLEGEIMPYIVHTMGVSGGAATRLMSSLDRDKGPTAYLFRCLACEQYHFHIDTP